MSDRWHILRDDASWTLSRRLPVEWHIEHEALVPLCHPIRLMHQVRQDVWRSMQSLRGFAPAVSLTPEAGQWRVRAGGAALGTIAPIWVERLVVVLDAADNQARWVRHAGSWEVRE